MERGRETMNIIQKQKDLERQKRRRIHPGGLHGTHEGVKLPEG